MTTVLIAHSSEEIAAALNSIISCKYSTFTCCDTETAIELIRAKQPDAMILDMSLPGAGGFHVLEITGNCLPEVILATVWYPKQEILSKLYHYGVDCVLALPGKIGDIIYKLEDLLKTIPEQSTATLKAMLRQLGIPSHMDGYKQLLVAVPMYIEDPTCIFSKEIYPAIADAMHLTSSSCVERSIRTAIEAGWKNTERGVWDTYFPGAQKRPAVRVFIAELSRRLAAKE